MTKTGKNSDIVTWMSRCECFHHVRVKFVVGRKQTFKRDGKRTDNNIACMKEK